MLQDCTKVVKIVLYLKLKGNRENKCRFGPNCPTLVKLKVLEVITDV